MLWLKFSFIFVFEPTFEQIGPGLHRAFGLCCACPTLSPVLRAWALARSSSNLESDTKYNIAPTGEKEERDNQENMHRSEKLKVVLRRAIVLFIDGSLQEGRKKLVTDLIK